MRIRRIFYLIIIVLLGLSCSEKNPIFEIEGNSLVQLQITFEQIGSQFTPLAKIATVTKVVITVTGEDMSTVTEDLEVDLETGTATGKVKVPKGDSRTFQVDGIDGNDINQFSGSTTQDIEKDIETVEIDVHWITPDPVDFTISNVTSTTADVSWTASNSPDFSFYRILVSTSQPLDPNNDGVLDISDLNSTNASLYNLSSNTTYYVSIIVIDTELLYDGYVKSFTTAQIWELSYDDDSFETGLVGIEQNQTYLVLFSAPSYPARLIACTMKLQGTQEFNIGIMSSEPAEILGDISTTGTDASSYAWSLYDLRTLEITLNNDFWVFIMYTGPQQSDERWWPAIGLDQTSPAGRSYIYIPSLETVDPLDDFGWPGNLGIRAFVEIGGGLISLMAHSGEIIKTELQEIDTGNTVILASEPNQPPEATIQSIIDDIADNGQILSSGVDLKQMKVTPVQILLNKVIIDNSPANPNNQMLKRIVE